MFLQHKKPDIKHSLEKFHEKKEPFKRLKNLQTAVGLQGKRASKDFFNQHYYVIYHVFHDAFSSIEPGWKAKGSRVRAEGGGRIDDLYDIVLPTFQKILIFLPELINRRWQCNSIGVVLKKLLHHANPPRLRKYGVDLLLLWLQGLRENVSPQAEHLFATVVPEFPPHMVGGGTVESPTDDSSYWVTGPDFSSPILGAIGESMADEHTTIDMLECLTNGLVSQSNLLVWDSPVSGHSGFDCLYHLFKKHYLYLLFPKARLHQGPYSEGAAFERSVSASHFEYNTAAPVYNKAREFLISWLARHISPQLASENGSASGSKLRPQSEQSTTMWHLPTSSSPATTPEDEDLVEVREIILGTQENIILIHEILRQTFLLPFTFLNTMECGLQVIRNWIAAAQANKRPRFMQDPPGGRSTFLAKLNSEPSAMHLIGRSPTLPAQSVVESETESVEESATPRARGSPIDRQADGHVSPYWLRKRSGGAVMSPSSPTNLSMSPVSGLSSVGNDVRAGIQANLRLFISETLEVFLTEPTHQTLHQQVEACSRVIRFYQTLAMKSLMDQSSWAHLLASLLRITKHVLGGTIPPAGGTSMPQQLAHRLGNNLVKTVFVLWINASLAVTVPISLWDDILELLTSLTHWPAVIDQWKHIMKMMTRLLARFVYNLELTQPSQNVPSTRRGRLQSRQSQPSNAASTPGQPDPGPGSVPGRPGPEGASRHSRVESISTSIENFTAKDLPSRPKLSKMPSFDEGAEHPPSEQPRSLAAGANNSTTSASLRGLRERVQNAGLPSVLHEDAVRPTTQSLPTSPMDGDSIVGDSQLSSEVHPSSSVEGDSANTVLCEESPSSLNIESALDSATVAEGTADRASLSNRDGSVLEAAGTNSLAPSEVADDDDFQPVRRERATTMASLEAKDLFASPLGTLQTVYDEDLGPDAGLEVLAGGKRQGWTATSAAVLWHRTLSILGNINTIAHPDHHAKAMGCLFELWEDLLRIRNRDGEAKSMPDQTEHDPPMLIFAPWVFQACSLGEKYKEGKLIAYQLLCHMTLERFDHPLPEDYLAHTYRLIHEGLHSSDQDVMDCVVRHAMTIFSAGLPGVAILIGDFIHAAEKILASENSMPSMHHMNTLKAMKPRPRREALTVLGSLLHYAYVFPDMKVLQVDQGDSKPTSMSTMKEKLMSLLLHTTKREPFRQSRCLALAMLGMFVCSEYLHRQSKQRTLIIECINVLLLSIRFPEHSVATAALDMILLFTSIHHLVPEQLALKIIEILCTTIAVVVNDTSPSVQDRDNRDKVVVRTILTLTDWVMILPVHHLTSSKFEQHSTSLIQGVFQVLQNVSGEELHRQVSTTSLNSNASTNKEWNSVKTAQASQEQVVDGSKSLLVGERIPQLEITEPVSQAVKLTGRAALSKLMNFMGHYPFGGGAARLSSSVIECDDDARYAGTVDLVPQLFTSPNVQFFSLNDTSIISLVELPVDSTMLRPPGLESSQACARVIIRDVSGKWTWDSVSLFGSYLDKTLSYPGSCSTLVDQNATAIQDHLRVGMASTAKNRQDGGRAVVALPSVDSFSAPDGNILEELLTYIGDSSSECQIPDQPSTTSPVVAACLFEDVSVEHYLVDALSQQHKCEQSYLDVAMKGMLAESKLPDEKSSPMSSFHHCRCILHHLGYLSPEKLFTNRFDLLHKNDRLLRELKFIDSRLCRETHKIGVLYVGHGQDEKKAILSNTTASAAFEEFLAALSWEVDITSHPGFMGGLQRSATAGSTTPYFATPSVEAIFHVSTRMPTVKDDGGINALRHIGNDEIQIIWSEHSRNWKRDIIRTEFGDVMIVIYPMKNGLFRIQIIKKDIVRGMSRSSASLQEKVPFFGPLFDGAVVDRLCLPVLVRATAINASRAKRSQISLFQPHYQERAQYISTLINHCKLTTTLEHFTSLVVQPGRQDEACEKNHSSKGPDELRIEKTPPQPLKYVSLSARQASYVPSPLTSDAVIQGSGSAFSFSDASAVSGAIDPDATLGDDVFSASMVAGDLSHVDV